MVCSTSSLILVSCTANQDNEGDTVPPTPNPDPNPDPDPIPPVLNELQKGGEISLNSTTLKVDKYLKVIKALDFTEYSNISNLTNDFLNTNLESGGFATLKLKIISGSSQTGVLKLSLNGSYDGHNIDNEIIDISGFLTNKYTNHSVSLVSLAQINQLNFIKDLRDEENIQTINLNDFLKYNNEILIQQTHTQNQRLSLNNLVQNQFATNFSFNQVNLKGKPWSISFDFIGKIYEDNVWKTEKTQKINLLNYYVNLDINQAALNILAQTIKIREHNALTPTYASTIWAKWKQTIPPFNQYIILDDRIANKYFNDVELIKMEAQNLTANDITGVLSGGFTISTSGVPKIASFKATIKNFKTTSDLLSDANLAANKNKIVIDQGSQFETNLIKDVVAQKSQIESLEIGANTQLNANLFTKSWATILNSNDTLFNNQLNDVVSGDVFNDSLRYLTNLNTKGIKLNILGRNGTLKSILSRARMGAFEDMYIELISVLQNDAKIMITKINATDYKIIYNTNINLVYLGGSQNITLTNETTININTQTVVS